MFEECAYTFPRKSLKGGVDYIWENLFFSVVFGRTPSEVLVEWELSHVIVLIFCVGQKEYTRSLVEGNVLMLQNIFRYFCETFLDWLVKIILFAANIA